MKTIMPLTLAILACLIISVAADESTPTPMADMALAEPEMKSSTEKPPKAENDEKMPSNSPVQTVGDFIIHPIVAFRPRPNQKEGMETPAGKQADGASTTAAPWPVIGLGYGQAIGSSVSNLAGQITGWINDRIQIPGLESTTASSVSSTTTTQRPDVIVRVQHRPSITINPNRRKTRPVEFESVEATEDYEQDENEDEPTEDEYDGEEIEENYDEEEDEEEEPVKPVKNRRKPVNRPQQNRRQPNKRPVNQKRRPQFNNYDDYAEDDSEDEVYYTPFSAKRSQQQQNFLQLGQQSLLNQIRLLTRGQNNAQLEGTGHQESKPTILVRRNGETLYLGQDLLAEQEASPVHYQPAKFPQPPLTKPFKVNGQVHQYITIPYNQLGVVPPQGANAVAEGIQAQPLILSIPQSAFQKMQTSTKGDSSLITPNAVPLLTEASLADIFKPPQIPPSRTQMNTPKPITAQYSPIVVLTQGSKVRPSTLVEKAPTVNFQQIDTEDAYIIVNDDNEEGRQARPVAKRRFAVRRGRELDQSQAPLKEELIPVQIVEEATPTPNTPAKINEEATATTSSVMQTVEEATPAPAVPLKDVEEKKDIESTIEITKS